MSDSDLGTIRDYYSESDNYCLPDLIIRSLVDSHTSDDDSSA